MHQGIKKLSDLRVICYSGRLIDLNKYLALLPWDSLSNKIRVTELNKTLLNSMPNMWSKLTHVQGFDCE